VVFGFDTQQTASAMAEIELKRYIKSAGVFQITPSLAPSRRPFKAYIDNGAWYLRPLGMHCPIGQCQVTTQRREQVKAHWHGRQQVGVQAISVERLVLLWIFQAVLNGLLSRSTQKTVFFLACHCYVDSAPQLSRNLSLFRAHGLQSDRNVAGLTPERLLESGTTFELGCLDVARYTIDIFKAEIRRESK
jgi:hypothetical protein